MESVQMESIRWNPFTRTESAGRTWNGRQKASARLDPCARSALFGLCACGVLGSWPAGRAKRECDDSEPFAFADFSVQQPDECRVVDVVRGAVLRPIDVVRRPFRGGERPRRGADSAFPPD